MPSSFLYGKQETPHSGTGRGLINPLAGEIKEVSEIYNFI